MREAATGTGGSTAGMVLVPAGSFAMGSEDRLAYPDDGEGPVREFELDGSGGVLLPLAIYLVGIYGGYFGAAQGILLLAILGVALSQDLHRTNALKNVLAGLVNGVAALYFIFAAHVDWGPAAVIAGSSILGAQVGARYGRRLSPGALRAIIVLVGASAIVRLLLT